MLLSPSPDVRGQEGCRWSSFPFDSDRKSEIERRPERRKRRGEQKTNDACEKQKETQRQKDKRQ